jgi:hydrogenase maturation protease
MAYGFQPALHTLCIAVGNPLRGDDGVAHRVLDLLPLAPGLKVRRAPQLAPELSEEIARARNVVFIDADIGAGPPHIERIAPRDLRGSPLSHAMTPAEVVCLATRLFGFEGAAFVCHVPGIDFDPGEGLSAEAEANAHRATQMIGGLCCMR